MNVSPSGATRSTLWLHPSAYLILGVPLSSRMPTLPLSMSYSYREVTSTSRIPGSENVNRKPPQTWTNVKFCELEYDTDRSAFSPKVPGTAVCSPGTVVIR